MQTAVKKAWYRRENGWSTRGARGRCRGHERRRRKEIVARTHPSIRTERGVCACAMDRVVGWMCLLDGWLAAVFPPWTTRLGWAGYLANLAG